MAHSAAGEPGSEAGHVPLPPSPMSEVGVEHWWESLPLPANVPLYCAFAGLLPWVFLWPISVRLDIEAGWALPAIAVAARAALLSTAALIADRRLPTWSRRRRWALAMGLAALLPDIHVIAHLTEVGSGWAHLFRTGLGLGVLLLWPVAELLVGIVRDSLLGAWLGATLRRPDGAVLRACLIGLAVAGGYALLLVGTHLIPTQSTWSAANLPTREMVLVVCTAMLGGGLASLAMARRLLYLAENPEEARSAGC